jgi:hypothetical protein
MSINIRETIVFFLPLEMGAFTGSSTPYGSAGDSGSVESLEDLYSHSTAPNKGVAWDRRQLYLNPQSINIRDQKIVQKQLTKGGHVVQYWGEELPTIDVQGTTGSAGIEGINILKDIYRHEQLHYRNVLANRQRELASAAALAQAEAEEQIYDANVGGFLLGTADTLTGGAVSKSVKGVANSIDILFGTSIGGGAGGSGKAFKSVPTLAAFATNIDMYYQGEFFRGYFTNFGVTETAQEPGHFSYTFNFVVTRRTGKRENFMPWHRSPTSFDGETIMCQEAPESKGSWPGVERLSFLSDESSIHGQPGNLALDANNSSLGPNTVSSEFIEAPENVPSAANQVANRRNSLIKNGPL